MADALGVATRLKMSSHPAAAEGQEGGSKVQGASSGGPASSAAALTQGPVLHVTQVKLRIIPVQVTRRAGAQEYTGQQAQGSASKAP